MSDVRALLRAERAAREPPKDRNGQPKGAGNPQLHDKKRKVAQDTVLEQSSRKRTKEIDEQENQEVQNHDAFTATDNTEASQPRTDKTTRAPAEAVIAANVDEDEWAAFERDVATPPPSPPKQTAISALQSEAAITAAPTTKAESEAEQRKEKQQAKRARQEEDLAAEKEDAARHMEDEFAEMDALEQRIKRLKEQREQLRNASTENIDVDEKSEESMIGTSTNSQRDNNEVEDSEDEDEDDAWIFGKR